MAGCAGACCTSVTVVDHVTAPCFLPCDGVERRPSHEAISVAILTLDLLADLTRARQDKGLSQEGLANVLGVDRQSIYRLERGVGPVSLLVRTMEALDFHIIGLAKGGTLPQQLQNRRQAMGWTKKDVSLKAGVMVSTVTRLERGDATIDSALKVLAAIGTKRMARKQPNFLIVTPLQAGEKDKRFSPVPLLRALEATWGRIDLDPCGHPESPVQAKRRILLQDGGDGLRDEWSGNFAYVNPPFSAATAWLKRADEMWLAGKVRVIVVLIPSKTDNAFLHDYLSERCDIGFLRSRLQFGRGEGGGKPTSAPFASMLVVWGATPEELADFRARYPSLWLLHDRPAPAVEADEARVLEIEAYG